MVYIYIYTSIYHKNQLINVGKYTIHGWLGRRSYDLTPEKWESQAAGRAFVEVAAHRPEGNVEQEDSVRCWQLFLKGLATEVVLIRPFWTCQDAIKPIKTGASCQQKPLFFPIFF